MRDDKRDPPIDPQDYLSGVTVVDIGDYRVSRGMSRRRFTACPHKKLSYDVKERRIWCADCEHDVDSFDILVSMVGSYDRAVKRLAERERQLKEAEHFQARSLAAREMDKAWRSRTMVPACPSCGNGLFPEDFKRGVSMLGRDFALARRGKDRP